MTRRPVLQGEPRRRDLARTTFLVLLFGALLGASLWILRPFLGPTVWATMVVVATWPLLLQLQHRVFRGRRGPAVAVMTLVLLLLFVVPLTLAIVTLVDNADRIVDAARRLTTLQMPEQAPRWLLALPMLGDHAGAWWAQARDAGLQGLLARLQPYAGSVTRWFVAEVGSLGFLLLQFLMTVAIAGVMYAGGERAGAQVLAVARRLGGVQGEQVVHLAGDAIRGVALGVGVTALVQALLGGAGLVLAGVPFAGVLTAAMFMLCIAQIGALPVLVPATAWAFWQGEFGWGVFLAVWSAVVGTLDNFIRPVLIRLGADLPLLLIFAGVIGGMFAFGLVGIFVGPVLLAVAWTLLRAWAGDGREPAVATGLAPQPPDDAPR